MSKGNKRKHRYENKKHLMWVTTQQCIISQAGFYSCSGTTQAHHLLKPYNGVRGMSLRANDRNVVPLCMKHHHLLHTKYGDEYKFFASFGLKPDYGKEQAQKYFIRFQIFLFFFQIFSYDLEYVSRFHL